MNVIFREIEYKSAEWFGAVRLRERILRKPLGSHFSDKELEEEKGHFQIAGFIGNELIATSVLVPEVHTMKMQRVVVAENHRNSNIGSEMMVFCEKFALNRGFEEVYCHARDAAVPFYLKNNYRAIGDYFDEDGIPHLKMKKDLRDY